MLHQLSHCTASQHQRQQPQWKYREDTENRAPKCGRSKESARKRLEELRVYTNMTQSRVKRTWGTPRFPKSMVFMACSAKKKNKKNKDSKELPEVIHSLNGLANLQSTYVHQTDVANSFLHSSPLGAPSKNPSFRRITGVAAFSRSGVVESVRERVLRKVLFRSQQWWKQQRLLERGRRAERPKSSSGTKKPWTSKGWIIST